MSHFERERLQSEDGSIRVPEFRRFELTAGLSETEENNARVVQWSRTTEDYELAMPFKVYAGVEGQSGGIGTQGYALYMRDSRRWESIIPPTIKCAILTSDLGGTGSATATLYTANAGTETDSGLDDVTVYDWLGDSGFKVESGSKVFVSLVDGHWYVIGAGACPVAV